MSDPVIWCPENCPRSRLALELGLGGNFPWGQFSENQLFEYEQLSTLIKSECASEIFASYL